MSRLLLITSLLAFSANGIGCAQQSDQQPEERISTTAQRPEQRGGRGDNGAQFGWTGDYNAAKEESKKTGKPIMLVFRCVP